nr:MAG TPA: hypothetical protein [Caudoviricetes sp.]
MKYLKLEKGNKGRNTDRITDIGVVILLEIAIIYFSIRVIQSLYQWYSSHQIFMLALMIFLVLVFWAIGFLLFISTIKDNEED